MTRKSTLNLLFVLFTCVLISSAYYSHQHIRILGNATTYYETLTPDGQAPINSFNVKAVPTSDYVTINYHSITDFTGEIVVANILGKPIREIQNAFKKGKQQVNLDFCQLSEGLYLIALSDGFHQKTQRFRLQRTKHTSP